MILFLDFDGVLHPQHDGEPTPVDRVFCHLTRFEAVMRDFPNVEIVISSTWRYQFTLDQLRARFSPDIAARIIDTTPQTERHLESQYLPARREEEILDWLVTTGRECVPWIALDDAAWQFERHRDRLIACTWYVGLDDAAEMKLRAALASGKTDHNNHAIEQTGLKKSKHQDICDHDWQWDGQTMSAVRWTCTKCGKSELWS